MTSRKLISVFESTLKKYGFKLFTKTRYGSKPSKLYCNLKCPSTPYRCLRDIVVETHRTLKQVDGNNKMYLTNRFGDFYYNPGELDGIAFERYESEGEDIYLENTLGTIILSCPDRIKETDIVFVHVIYE